MQRPAPPPSLAAASPPAPAAPRPTVDASTAATTSAAAAGSRSARVAGACVGGGAAAAAVGWSPFAAATARACAARPGSADGGRAAAGMPHARRVAAPDADAVAGPDTDAARAGIMLPKQLLQPGEIIVLLLKPHPLFILLAPLKTLTLMLLVTAVGVEVARRVGEFDAAQNIVLIGAALLLARVFWQFLEWLSRVYVLTDQRVIALSGVISVRVFESPLNSITHTELLFSLRERIFGLGSLAFYTAGSGVAEAYWVMVGHPLEIHAKVVQTLKRYRR